MRAFPEVAERLPLHVLEQRVVGQLRASFARIAFGVCDLALRRSCGGARRDVRGRAAPVAERLADDFAAAFDFGK